MNVKVDRVIKLSPEVLEYKRTPQTVKPYDKRGKLKVKDSNKKVDCVYEQNWLPVRDGKSFVEGWQVSIPKMNGEPIVNENGILKFIQYLRFEAK